MSYPTEVGLIGTFFKAPDSPHPSPITHRGANHVRCAEVAEVA